ncbi:M23 family metallopeptidase [Glacieibacterium frigidum]|uniref:M23 family metallopeptidase n=2 Tax=Glacieibacterium frigidum TaxID=2593303 RepID=A0A552UAR9_9SPHN|nr:M23 family metallopeptidase [Glacieibacterium frigidum]
MLPRDAAPAPVDSALEPFRKVENAQLAFVDKATDAARARLQGTQSLLRRLGLDPNRFVAQSDITGTGGPYVPVNAPSDADPRFKSLFVSWKKLAALETAMAAIPSYVPVKSFSTTSTYGVRYDPFTGNTAMHAGLDMAGSHGEPIYAAADGLVTTGGRSGAYGNLVELAHGKGLATRYGHLSAITVRPGEQVRQGQMIGRMGSTGRSTGTHLHYEIRIDGRAVNPRPYLDASAFMLAAQNRGEAQGPIDATLIAEDDNVTFDLAAATGGQGGMSRIVRN